MFSSVSKITVSFRCPFCPLIVGFPRHSNLPTHCQGGLFYALTRKKERFLYFIDFSLFNSFFLQNFYRAGRGVETSSFFLCGAAVGGAAEPSEEQPSKE